MSDVEKKALMDRIREAIQLGAKKARLEHKLAGIPIVVSDKDGNVKYIAPEDIVV